MRGKPTYDLHLLQQLVGQGELSRTITKAATQGALLLDLDRDAIIEAVLLLRPGHFYKTMESELLPGMWQDVYHLEFRGKRLYIKLQLADDGRAFVVQFKQR
jgi:hypothetical protein